LIRLLDYELCAKEYVSLHDCMVCSTLGAEHTYFLGELRTFHVMTQQYKNLINVTLFSRIKITMNKYVQTVHVHLTCFTFLRGLVSF